MDIRKAFTVFLCLGLVLSAGAQTRKLLEFQQREVNLDTLRFDADSILITFTARNIADKPVTILDVHSSCGCFTGSASHKAIAPGASAKVEAWFKPGSMHGDQNRHLTVVVTDGTDQVLHSLTAKAYVLRDQSEGEIRFAEDLGQGLRTDMLRVGLTRDKAGDYLLRVPLYNDTDAPVSVEFIGPRRLKLFAPSVIAPRSREDVRGIYNARWIRRGREVHEKLQIRVNGTEVLPIEITRKF